VLLHSIDPSTGRGIRSYPAHSAADIERALRRGHRAFESGRYRPFPERARYLRALARELRRRESELAALATAEMGKPITQSRAEIAKCAVLCDFYAAHAAGFLAPQRPPSAPAGAAVTFEPIGIILAIMPWNFPFWQAFRAAVPALAAGNSFLLKHAPNVSGCAQEIERVFARAGVPAGVFQSLRLPNSAIPKIIADPRVQAVTLTGSTGAGRHVAALAGQAMKKGVYELGGSDASLILADADLDQAAEICAASRLINSGQSCVCAKRFIVVSSVRSAFEEKFAARLQARTVGNPRLPETQVGPLARRDLRDNLHRQVLASIKAGAKLVFGGHPLPGPGYFYAPTLLTGVKPGMPAYDEELFGPVAALISVRHEAEAIAVANDSPYGLGASVYSQNLKRARRVAAQIEAGSVYLNDFVKSDPSLPFGGVKLSGHGRELGAFGIHEFVNIKTICGS
jgi:succinate-semialdehyde dehydrogenase/glutarate-semialdehyde dehydrogenase